MADAGAAAHVCTLLGLPLPSGHLPVAFCLCCPSSALLAYDYSHPANIILMSCCRMRPLQISVVFMALLVAVLLFALMLSHHEHALLVAAMLPSKVGVVVVRAAGVFAGTVMQAGKGGG